MTKPFEDIMCSKRPEEEAPAEPDPAQIEVVSVTEEDLPPIETPNTVNVSPLGSFCTESQPEIDPAKPTEPKPAAAPGPTMPITKVQPFINEDDVIKTWKTTLMAHRLELLIASGLVLLIFILGIGLGVGLRCSGKFRCGSSSRCISTSAQCDGEEDCEGGEDELGCVRLSGKRSVLQVLSGGSWRTVCSEAWSDVLSLSACRQLGYSRFVESLSAPLSSIEPDFRADLVSINLSLTEIIKLQNSSYLSKTQCSSGNVTTLKCIACGSRPQFHSRIVGGNFSRAGQFPWQVSLHYRNEHLCGGSIISTTWILTAAHCMYGFSDPSMWSVHVGLTEQPGHGAQSLAVEQIVYHARYRDKALDYDIALMRLSESLHFNGLVEPICLPNYGEEFEEGTMCWISGWGATEDGGQGSLELRSAQVALISTKTCNQQQVYGGFISPWMLCAGYLEGGVDSCQGDSGGPLSCEDASVWKLIGATSWGMGCAMPSKPGVYTRITQALSWVRQQMERVEAQNPGPTSTDQ
ncbi:transmembrane protease serine 3 [Genypterus blacodes]|uniref:transmembrane protease serine 3 n=1 Tax=Genypterus blacodes TaxID=154954 RepID=UPI003F7685E5